MTEEAKVAKPQPAPKKRAYAITVFMRNAQAIEREMLTPEEAVARVKEIIAEGYVKNEPGKSIVFPAHVIEKVELLEIEVPKA